MWAHQGQGSQPSFPASCPPSPESRWNYNVGHFILLSHIPTTTATPLHPTPGGVALYGITAQALCLLPPGNLTSQTSPPPALCLPNTHSPMRIHAHLHISSSSASKVHIPYPKITQLLRALLVLLLLTKWIPFSLSSRKPMDFLCLPLFSLLWSFPVAHY